MVQQHTAKSAAESFADEYVGTDANMTNANTIANDDDFRSLAVARKQLGHVGGSLPGLTDTDADIGRYAMSQTETAREAVMRAMDVRAGEVLDEAHATDDETPAGIEQVTL